VVLNEIEAQLLTPKPIVFKASGISAKKKYTVHPLVQIAQCFVKAFKQEYESKGVTDSQKMDSKSIKLL